MKLKFFFLFLIKANLSQNYKVDKDCLYWDSISISAFFFPLSPLVSGGMEIDISAGCNFSLRIPYHNTTLQT